MENGLYYLKLLLENINEYDTLFSVSFSQHPETEEDSVAVSFNDVDGYISDARLSYFGKDMTSAVLKTMWSAHLIPIKVMYTFKQGTLTVIDFAPRSHVDPDGEVVFQFNPKDKELMYWINLMHDEEYTEFVYKQDKNGRQVWRVVSWFYGDSTLSIQPVALSDEFVPILFHVNFEDIYSMGMACYE